MHAELDDKIGVVTHSLYLILTSTVTAVLKIRHVTYDHAIFAMKRRVWKVGVAWIAKCFPLIIMGFISLCLPT